MSRTRSMATQSRPRVELLEHRDLPSFFPPVIYDVGESNQRVAIADVNADGRRDVAIVVSGKSIVGLYLGE